jgi:hypothetical protein
MRTVADVVDCGDGFYYLIVADSKDKVCNCELVRLSEGLPSQDARGIRQYQAGPGIYDGMAMRIGGPYSPSCRVKLSEKGFK